MPLRRRSLLEFVETGSIYLTVPYGFSLTQALNGRIQKYMTVQYGQINATTRERSNMTGTGAAGRLSGLVAALLLGGCISVPNLGPAPKLTAAESLASARSLDAPAADWPTDSWWKAYGDPQLDALIDEALKSSPNLDQARARVHKAEALAREAKGALYPTLGANSAVNVTRESLNTGFPHQFTPYLPHGYLPFTQDTLNLDYALDVWGANRKAFAAATSEALAARADAAQVRLTLAAGVASTYADLARLYAERDDAIEVVRIRDATLNLFAERGRNGLETRGVTDQSISSVATAKGQVASLDEQIALSRNRLAALVGAGPDRGLAIARPTIGALKPFGLPARLPADLLGRRPDLIAARLRAEAASSRIGQAKAAFYPNIDLAAYAGQEVLGLQLLGRSTSNMGQLGAAIHLPIFDAGRINGAYRGARADYDLAAAAYDQTLVQALQDVADATASQRALAVELGQARAAETAADQAFKIAGLRYKAGLSNYLAVLSAEDQLVAARRSRVDLEARGFTLDVSLALALGGGFHSV
jgi:NodT family efflux transporter outer membrane factor (OMF) lipoprotein